MTYILILLAILFLIAMYIGNEDPLNYDYNASFGDPDKFLSRWNKGFAIGPYAFEKSLSVTHCMTLGPTSSGKSSIVCIPAAVSLARGKSSIVFNDVSGELWSKTSGYLASNGYRILRLDFSDARHSESFNPLQKVSSIADIQKLCLIITQNSTGESKSDPFWENSAVALLSLFCRLLVFHTEKKFHTLQNLQRLIETFAYDEGQIIDRLFVQTKDATLLASYKATIAMGDRTLQSIIATARASLHIFNDPEICRTTATNTIDFSLLHKEPVAIYVSNPLKDLKYFKSLSTLFYQELFNYVLSRPPGQETRFIGIILDEFSSMKFPDVSLTISNLRKYNCGLLLCMQSEMALLENYGQAQAAQIKTNCGIQIYLKGEPMSTCKELSQTLGKFSYTDEKGNIRTRELMTPDEIRTTDDAIVLISNKSALRITPVPYFKSYRLRSLVRTGVYPLPQKELAELPLIPL